MKISDTTGSFSTYSIALAYKSLYRGYFVYRYNFGLVAGLVNFISWGTVNNSSLLLQFHQVFPSQPLAFFIPRNSHAARISLGITSVLTTTTIMNIQNNSMPKVSYIKFADWYLIVCFLFVFSTLLEFTLVLHLTNTQVPMFLKPLPMKSQIITARIKVMTV